jgi:hypothetical protein
MNHKEKVKAISAKFKHLKKNKVSDHSIFLLFQASVKTLKNITKCSKSDVDFIYEAWCSASGG